MRIAATTPMNLLTILKGLMVDGVDAVDGVDGVEVNRHREVLAGEGKLVFDPPNHLRYLARDNGEFTPHEVELNPQRFVSA